MLESGECDIQYRAVTGGLVKASPMFAAAKIHRQCGRVNDAFEYIEQFHRLKQEKECCPEDELVLCPDERYLDFLCPVRQVCSQ